jgi:hypothetical protein
MEKPSCGCGAAQENESRSCGCGAKGQTNYGEKWMRGFVQTPAGLVPRASTELAFSDTWGTWKARWDINRMDYAIDPGLYCVGDPAETSPVLVTANYKMTFDKLRKELSGLDAWILVLDTKGVNVWCAAGKGTFGTKELVHRIEATGLKDVVSHRTLILPQLGATGVSAHEVVKQSGFKVVYGPVRAKDIKAFIAAGNRATPEMRRVRFDTVDRLVLTPVEVVTSIKPFILVFGVLFILNAIGFGHYNAVDLYAALGAIFTGCVLTPVLLPWIPGRAFSFKGFLTGMLWAVGVNFINGWPGTPSYGWLKAIAYLLIIPAITSYAALNYTGTSTYTSLTGVDKEMKYSLPAIILAAIASIGLFIANDIVLLAA